MRTIKNITIIGAGNVATHLGKALYNKGLNIDAVFSRKLSRAKKLSSILKAKATNKYKSLPSYSDLYLIAVSDDVIRPVSKQLSKVIEIESIIAHTSGSVPCNAIEHETKGVFYPLQSITISRDLDIKKVPFCIYSDDHKVEKLLLALARKISKNVNKIDDEKRAILHLSAIFASNFSNHMYHLAESICKENKVDFDILKPLISETAKKLRSGSAYDMQTGPARRNDETTIAKHLRQLAKHKKAKAIYKLVSDNIKSTYH